MSPVRPTTRSTRARGGRVVLDTFGSLDLLVNNTGSNYAHGPLIGLDAADAPKTVETNCIAALSWIQHAYRGWMGDHGGAVVNIVVGGGRAPGLTRSASTVHQSDADLSREQLAVELGPAIRVNAVAPAVVKTQVRRTALCRPGGIRRRDLPAQAAGRSGRHRQTQSPSCFRPRPPGSPATPWSWTGGITLVGADWGA